MSTRPRTTLAAAARAGVWALLLTAGGTLPACDGPIGGPPSDPFGRLRTIAARPGSPARDLEAPAPNLSTIPESDPRCETAHAPLASLDPAALLADADQTGEPSIPETLAGDARATAEDVTADTAEALTLYARARQMLAADDANGAIGLLERATILDPAAPELWRSLGDARRAARFENSAGLAYTRAAELGLAEPEALTLAGLHASERGDTARAAAWLLTAVRADPPHADPLVGFVASAALGEALLGLGYDAAGATALGVGLDIPRVARVPTNLGREAATVQRRRAGLLVRLGDAHLALGDETNAIAAYETARAIPGAPGVQERLVYALRRSGNDAGAALILLEELEDGARVSNARIRALATLAERVRPRDAVADTIGAIDDRGSPTRRARLLAARAAALPPRDASRVLGDAVSLDTSLSAPSRQSLIRAGIETLARRDTAEALGWTLSLIEQTPGLAPDAAIALVRARGVPGGLGDALDAARGDPLATDRLRGELALLHADRDRIERSLDGAPLDRADPASLALRARLAAAIGAWDAMDDAIRLLSEEGPTRDLAFTLRSAQRFGDALAALPPAAEITPESERPVDTLLERSALASLTGDADGARDALERALDADPRDERVYAALLALHAPDGPLPDAEALSAAGRRLREISPDSDLLRAMLGGEMLRRGLNEDAAGVILPMFEDEPTAPPRLDAVLSLWRRRAATEGAAENELALAESAAGLHPNAPGPVRLLVGGLVLADRVEEAIERIDAFDAATGDRSLASLREQVIRDGLGDTARAERLALERLAPQPRPIGDSVALAELHARRLGGETPLADTLASIAEALASIPGGAGLTAPQLASVRSTVTRAAVAVDSVPATGRSRPPLLPPEAARATLDLLAWGVGRGVDLAPGVHELRLLLLDRENAPADDLIGAARDAIDQAVARAGTAGAPDPVNLERAFLRRAADMLVARDDADRAFDWLATRALGGSTDGDAIRGPAFREWFRLAVIAEDAERGRAFIETLRTSGRLPEAWPLLRPDEWDGVDTGEPAEIAYLLALYTPDSDESGDVPSAYLRLALAYDPGHPWAANDLGYTMLEAGEDLAEAERLIEIAYNARPDRANIIDSLGWVRYHRGKVEDAVDPMTGEAVLGAISLLERAVALSEPDDDGIVHDHLGDALYAAGRTEEAIDAWRRAARLANQALSRLRAAGRADGVRSRELSDLAVRAIMKPNAIQLGQEPEVEPQRGAQDQSPTAGE